MGLTTKNTDKIYNMFLYC